MVVGKEGMRAWWAVELEQLSFVLAEESLNKGTEM